MPPKEGRKDTLEIIKQRDDYPYSLEVSQNSKGEAQLTVKCRFEKLPDGPTSVTEKFKLLLKELKDACVDQGIPVAGVIGT